VGAGGEVLMPELFFPHSSLLFSLEENMRAYCLEDDIKKWHFVGYVDWTVFEPK
jgi:hypothetical protein